MYRIGLSSCGKTISEELFSEYSKAGIKAIEISVKPDVTPTLNFPLIRKMADAEGVALHSYHLPFMPFSKIDISSAELADSSVRYLSDEIRRASDAGIDLFILHPSAEPISEEDRPMRLARAKENIAVLSEVAATAGGRIAVENLPRTCLGRDSEDILALISVDERLGVCFDTNHLLSEDPVHFIRAVGQRIVTTHVSDYDLKNERHWLPGEGVTDWQALYAALVEIGYPGVWLYEIGFDSPNTVLRERKLTCSDFVRNANEIFLGKPITRLSTPVEGLVGWKE